MLTEERQNYYLQSSLSQAAQGVESVLNEIQLSTENYAYSAAVQELLRLTRNTDLCTPVHFDFNHEHIVVEKSRTAPTGSRSSAISDERIRQETERVFLGQKALKVPALLLYYNKEERKQKNRSKTPRKNW